MESTDACGVALDIGVVDAQNHCAAVPPRIEPIENEGTRASDVQKARRRGRETNSNHGNIIVACGEFSSDAGSERNGAALAMKYVVEVARTGGTAALERAKPTRRFLITGSGSRARAK